MSSSHGQTGILIISDGKAPVVADVVLVHGLQGHRVKTWTKEVIPPKTTSSLSSKFKATLKLGDGQATDEANRSLFWPQDLLAKDLPRVRILSYGYESSVLEIFRPVNKNNIHQHAENMLWDVYRNREDESRPIIFVCHSLGGIIVKEMLRLSKDSEHKPGLQSLYRSTHGVIFLGTPHRGSSYASWGILASNIVAVTLQTPHKGVLRDLSVDSVLLQVIADAFSNMIKDNKIRIHSFFEEKGMNAIRGFSGKVVDDFSSIIGDAAEGKEGISENHIDMCKFSGRDDNNYQKVSHIIANFVEAATSSLEVDEEGAISRGLASLPVTTRNAIIADREYNGLRRSEAGVLVLRIPQLSEEAFAAPSSYPLTSPSNVGSGAFKLARLLELLPDQNTSNSSLLETHELRVVDLLSDHNTYYGRTSRKGLLRLICDHFDRIADDGNRTVVITDIASFVFDFTNNDVVVRCNPRERSAHRRLVGNHDFSDVQRCASGEFRRCESLGEIDWNNPTVRDATGPLLWVAHDIEVVLLLQDLDNPECLRFLSFAQHREIEDFARFSDYILLGIEQVARRHTEAVRHMDQAFQLCQILRAKRIASRESLAVTISAAKLCVRDAIAGANNSQANLSAENTAVFMRQVENVWDELLTVFRGNMGGAALQSRMLALSDTQLDVLCAQGALALIVKGNAQLLLVQSVPVADRWLNLLKLQTDDYLSVG